MFTLYGTKELLWWTVPRGIYLLVLGASRISYTQEWVANVAVVFCYHRNKWWQYFTTTLAFGIK